MLAWLAEAAPGGQPPEYITQILQYGPAGVMLILILSGVLVTKAHFESMKKDRDEWRAAYEKECEAHNTTRAALAEATRATAASLEMAKTTTALLTNLGHLANRPEVG